MTLPNFIIIGVAKAGTTSLYRYLDQHPEVFMCPLKGTNYFGYEDALNWQWLDEGEPPLLQHFQAKTFEDYEAMFSGVTDEIAIGEASPQYFRCPNAAKRIHEALPDIKLIASLRNPADRAYSGFLMRTRRGEPVRSVSEELTADSSHVKEGFYYRRMKRYFDLFPKEQMKIILFEDFKRNPAGVVKDLYRFLAVDTGFEPDTTTRHNPAGVPKVRSLNRLFFHPKLIRTVKTIFPERLQETAKHIQRMNLKPPPKFPQEYRSALIDHYSEDILKLENLIDRDLSIWLDRTKQSA